MIGLNASGTVSDLACTVETPVPQPLTAFTILPAPARMASAPGGRRRTASAADAPNCCAVFPVEPVAAHGAEGEVREYQRFRL